MTTILDKICADKLEQVSVEQDQLPLIAVKKLASSQASAPRGFYHSLRTKYDQGHYGFICEIKKASPSKGLIRPNFKPALFAQQYEDGGAACISVLTDMPYFQGHNIDLQEARRNTTLPVLRKDFMLTPYQIYQSRAIGADCILLILSALDDKIAKELEQIALDLGMDVLIEVHDKIEMERAISMQSPLIGINNRNLKTMDVDVKTAITLAQHAPSDKLLVAESGLSSKHELALCYQAAIGCFLIGETFMRQDDITAAVKVFQR